MEQLLTIEQVADLLQKPVGWVMRQIQMDCLHVIVLGHDWRVEPEELRRYIENQKAVTPLIAERHLKATE